MTVLSDHLHQTVKPEDVFPIARLFLRWPYQTAENINSKLYEFRDEIHAMTWLTLFELKDVYYQSKAIEPYSCKGFLLRLKGIEVPHNFEYGELTDIFHNIFVLKEEIFSIEQLNRHYCALPSGYKTELQNEICTEKNFSLLAPRIFADIFQYRKQSAETEMATGAEISKKHLWPWLGPIIKDSPEKLSSRSIDDEAEEITDFIQTARTLEQNEPDCLARMVNYRYPRVSYPELVHLIEPEIHRTPSTATKLARRWLGFSR